MRLVAAFMASGVLICEEVTFDCAAPNDTAHDSGDPASASMIAQDLGGLHGKRAPCRHHARKQADDEHQRRDAPGVRSCVAVPGFSCLRVAAPMVSDAPPGTAHCVQEPHVPQLGRVLRRLNVHQRSARDTPPW